MTARLVALIAFLGLSLSACSQQAQTAQSTEPEPENRDIVVAAFASTDQNKDDKLDANETKQMASNMFMSMDYDDSATVSAKEFDDWDFGLIYTAADAGQSVEYDTAKKILFALRDINADGVISQEEYRQSLAFDFARADQDNDGSMSKDEYGKAFLPALLFRAALENISAE